MIEIHNFLLSIGILTKKKFKHLLIGKGMTQKALAEKAGISPNTIRNIKTERISFKNMCKIADALEVSLDEFR
ncbi:helix-turn-helix domain-containing protein [Streptococcus pneumoniae]|uniref:helix-turn-helix domain-containing protein n=1 Tax=Streptococcus pneumoniae TaxID=1313 RepID=UPI001C52990B